MYSLVAGYFCSNEYSLSFFFRKNQKKSDDFNDEIDFTDYLTAFVQFKEKINRKIRERERVKKKCNMKFDYHFKVNFFSSECPAFQFAIQSFRYTLDFALKTHLLWQTFYANNSI